jgi:RNA chaperone Hfq
METQQSERTTPLNDSMLSQFQDNNLEVSVYLANGIKLSGKIVAFDRETLVLTSDAGPEGVSITRSNIATMTRRSDEQRTRQEGGQRGINAQRQTVGRR